MSKLASWQINQDRSSYQNDHIQLFHFALRADIINAMVQHIEQVYLNADNESDQWEEYVTSLHDQLQSGALSVDDLRSPCDEFNHLWAFKKEALVELYNLVYGLYIQFSFDPFQLEIYREKVEQALDYISDKHESEPELVDYPFIEVDSFAFDITPEEAAHKILKCRSDWVKRMAHIESIKIPVKRSILSYLNDVSETHNAIEYGSAKLRECYTEWI